MAIYAFDGTTNTPGDLSNVFRMYDIYDSRHKFYTTGPGSRGTKVSKIIESITGHGGQERIFDALEIWKYWQSKGSRETVIVGFSRGAVIAREFANRVNDENGKIDFLGLFDSVGSFGNPANMKDIGYRKSIPGVVHYCAHAMSIDEERFSFRVIRAKPSADNDNSTIQECWFPGVHSDVGGTLKKGLGACSLDWMLEHAKQAGTKQWDEDVVIKVRKNRLCSEAPSENKLSLPRWFLKSLRTRKIEPGDQTCKEVSS